MKRWLPKLKSKEDRPKSKTKRKVNETKTERAPDDLKFGEFDGMEDENYIQLTETCKKMSKPGAVKRKNEKETLNNEKQPEEGLPVAGQSKSKGKSKTNDVEAKKWTNEETCHLIELLEEDPCLWDVYDKNYHMRDKRDQAYKDIETQLGVSVAAVNAKIVNLRSQLGREISKCNKTKSGQSVNEVY